MSSTRGPLGRDPFAPPCTATPGPLGHNDPAHHPHTPGPTGINDPYDPALTYKKERAHSSPVDAATSISVTDLRALFDKAANDYLRQVVEELNNDLQKYRLDSALRRAHFLRRSEKKLVPHSKDG